MALARSLTEPEVNIPSKFGLPSRSSIDVARKFDMEQQLSLFIRDEVMTWYTYFNKSQHADALFRRHVVTNIEIVVFRAVHLSCRAQDKDRERVSIGTSFCDKAEHDFRQAGSSPPVPAVQTITNLVRPIRLSLYFEKLTSSLPADIFGNKSSQSCQTKYGVLSMVLNTFSCFVYVRVVCISYTRKFPTLLSTRLCLPLVLHEVL
jgi:hypothetical protein